MPLTAAQIVTLATQDAKCPGYTSQAGQFLNAALQDYCQNYDLDAALGTFTFSFNSAAGNGSGPYNLPADYLRTQVKDGKDEFFYTINGVPYPLIQVTKAEYDWLVQTPGFSSYPYNYATDLSPVTAGNPAQLFVWPPASGSYPCTLRYYRLMPDIVTPETSAVVPWFGNTMILQRDVAGRLMGLTGDSRQEAYLGSDEERHPLGVGTLMRKYLKNIEDREGAVHTVGLDRRRFGRSFDLLKNTKTVGWLLAAFLLYSMALFTSGSAHANCVTPCTKAQLTTDINTNWPDNTTQLITPALLRSTVLGIVNSYVDTGSAGSLSCGLHQWQTGISSLSSISCAQPGFSDVTGLVTTTQGGTGANTFTNNLGDLHASNGTNGTFVATALNVICTLVPTVCQKMLGYNNIYWYGAKCDGIFQSNQNFDQPATNISITSGATLLTSSGSTFTSADVGKRIYVPFAGAAGADYSTTIASFVGATQVNVALAASTTVSAQAATNTHPFVYGTDDTTNIQNALNGTPTGGILFIPGSATGCVIRQQGSNAYALVQTRPFSVRGAGHFSTLMTFPDTPSTVDNFLVNNTAGGDWTSLSWDGFGISAVASFAPPSFLMNPRYGKRGLAFVDVTSSTNFPQIMVNNVTIGESGNDYSLYIGNPTSSGSQGDVITRNHIYGGVHLDHVSDSFILRDNFFYGASTKGGLFELVTGSAGFNFVGNNVTWTGCMIFEGGTKMTVAFNYFEEVVNATNCARNAMVDFNGGNGTINMPSFYSNVVNATTSTTATPVRYSNVAGGNFGDNYLSTSSARTGVTSVTSMSCISPNQWNSVGTHFSTALANTYAGC